MFFHTFCTAVFCLVWRLKLTKDLLLLQKWEEEENKKAKGDEKEEGKDDVDETTLKEHIDEKLMRLQSVIKELTGRDKERAGLDEPGKVPQNQEPEASEDRVLNESNGQDLHAHRGDDSQDQYAHRGGGKSEPGHSPSEGQTQDLRHDGPGRNQHECVVTPEQPRAEGTLQSAATEATVLQSAAAEATALQSAATEATVLQSAATEATALQSAAAEGTALQSAAAEATVLQSAAAEGTAAVLQSAAAEGTVLQSAATEGKVQEKPPGQAAVVRTHRKLKPLPPQGPGLNMKPTSLTRRTDATRTGLGGPRACSEAGSEIEN